MTTRTVSRKVEKRFAYKILTWKGVVLFQCMEGMKNDLVSQSPPDSRK